MKNILFVCTGNTCRSSMAEAIFKSIIKDDNDLKDLVVSSAGTNVFSSEPATGEAVRALEIMNFNLKNHRSRQITKDIISKADLILTMTLSHKFRVISISPEAESKIFTLKEYIDESNKQDIIDPYGMPLADYINCSEEIYNELVKLKDKLKKEVGK